MLLLVWNYVCKVTHGEEVRKEMISEEESKVFVDVYRGCVREDKVKSFGKRSCWYDLRREGMLMCFLIGRVTTLE